MFFEPDSAQPNQCISGPYRNKKKFSSDCEVYEGVKKGAERGAVTFQLVSEVRGLLPKSQKFHKIEGRGLPMAFHNLQSVQKRGAEKGAQF